ncbi:STE3-domain-containing protein [Peniophora sp. CONT]|nr:STE3-domain-containing protein [Peniophora sp. CONT]
MSGAVDPTYPLYPIACTLASTGVLLVLLTNFVRHSWNLGVTFLCFWLFVENLTAAINAVVWSDNADIKLLVYCDIVTRAQLVAFVVKPMATLIIMRRLYIITGLQSVELPSKVARVRNLLVEWILGLVLPMIVAGPIYYVSQSARSQVEEGFGCTNAEVGSILNILTIQSWSIVPPLLSITLYYPRVIRVFYQQNRDINDFLRSNGSVPRTHYLRIFVLASLDVLLTLPFGIVSIVLNVTTAVTLGGLPFYPGFDNVHSSIRETVTYSYADLQGFGVSSLARDYFSFWSSPVLAFAIFGLFGLTREAIASYWNIICTVGGWFGWKPATRWAENAHSQLGTMEFGAQPQESIPLDAEMGSHLSFIETSQAPSTELIVGCASGGGLPEARTDIVDE